MDKYSTAVADGSRPHEHSRRRVIITFIMAPLRYELLLKHVGIGVPSTYEIGTLRTLYLSHIFCISRPETLTLHLTRYSSSHDVVRDACWLFVFTDGSLVCRNYSARLRWCSNTFAKCWMCQSYASSYDQTKFIINYISDLQYSVISNHFLSCFVRKLILLSDF